jgi:hypothetical protein
MTQNTYIVTLTNEEQQRFFADRFTVDEQGNLIFVIKDEAIAIVAPAEWVYVFKFNAAVEGAN